MKSINELLTQYRAVFTVTFLALPFLFSGGIFAQQYPDKPIRLIVPFVAGGTPDFIARAIEPVLFRQLGQRVIVDNRTGAGGLIGTELAAKAEPDGYTLVVGGTANFCVRPTLQKNNKRYDVMKDFEHVALLAQAQLLIASHPSLPPKTIKDLIVLAKNRPNELAYASSGSGTTPHMLGALFTHVAGVDIRHIPYKGGPQAWTAVMSGEVDLTVGQVQQAISLIKAKRIKPLAVFGAKRSSSLPDVPNFTESGVKGLEVAVWYSISAPAKTPAAIVNRLNEEINKVLSDSGVQTRLHGGGLEILSSTPAETTQFTKDEIPRWADAVRISGAQVD